METAETIAKFLIDALQADEKLEITSTDKEPRCIGSPSLGEYYKGVYFDVSHDYEKNGVPARKRWLVSVQLVEDSTIDDNEPPSRIIFFRSISTRSGS